MVNSLKRSPSRRCSVSKDILSPSYTFGKSKLLKSPGDNSFIRIEEVDPTDINVKIEEVPLTIPKFNHSVKGKLAKVPGKNMITSKGKSGGERQTGNSKIAQKKQVVTKGKVIHCCCCRCWGDVVECGRVEAFVKEFCLGGRQN